MHQIEQESSRSSLEHCSTLKNVIGFITKTKTTISRLHKVGIDLPVDIIAYLILEKLPSSMDTVVQQITHSDRKVTPDNVLDHLRLFHNNISLGSGLANTKVESNNALSFFNKDIKPCETNWHNPRAAHPEGLCWKLYPQLRPSFPKKKKNNTTEFKQGGPNVRTFHSSFSHSSTQAFVIDSGSSMHMVSDISFFNQLDRSITGSILTSSGVDSLKYTGKGTVALRDKNGQTATISDVLYTPNSTANLLSF